MAAALKIKARPKADSFATSFVHGYRNDLLPPMTRAEETAAFTALRAGDESQRDLILRANLAFALSMIRGYIGRGVDPQDLAQEAATGMLTAIERFDPDKGFKFISYAVWWVRQALLEVIGETSQTARQPLNVRQDQAKLYRRQRQLETALQRPVSLEEAAEDLGLDYDHCQPLEYYSLDAPIPGNDEGGNRGTMYSNTTRRTRDLLSVQPTEDEEMDRDRLRERVAGLLANQGGNPFNRALEDRERVILKLYYGIDCAEGMTLEQIGALMGLTRERIRQLKEKALAKLKGRINGSKAELLEMVEDLR